MINFIHWLISLPLAWAITALLVLFGLWWFLFGKALKQKNPGIHTNDRTKKAQPEAGAKHKEEIAIAIQRFHIYIESRHDKEDTEAKKQARWGKATALFAFIAAIATAFAAGFTWKSLDYASEAVKSSQDAATSSQEAAVQAQRQADIAQQALIASTRAWLKITAVTGAYVTHSSIGGVAWFNFQPTYKNFGPSPAENISFSPHIFVTGVGPSPKEICEKDRTTSGDQITEMVFPQEQGGTNWIGTQVVLQALERQAAEVHAIQSSATIYLGVIGCLAYKSGISEDTYITGFIGDLHLVEAVGARDEDYIPLYDALIKSDPDKEIGMEVKHMSVWAD